ncbi:hypothetical protein F4821DRAFT_237847 [Hypoxylon rubiginosum]|uniref:Uncharacterized protein n=1 Tax=Hypoxylon rubiginosum TaxID=110542 RepID=A0ACC0D1U6_9PEZI|nr:hypothetical protein F4821DRAFT_237847 [Hypoxylon rubiginosum]
MPNLVKERIIRFLGRTFIIAPIFGLYHCVMYTIDGVEEVIHIGYKVRRHVRVKTRRLPKSKPLAKAPSSEPQVSKAAAVAKTSFLHLPVEIRLQIYRIALGGPGGSAIAQVTTHSATWGPRPEHWSPGQSIRYDADEPSAALRLITGLGGSGLRQLVAPPAHGCVHFACISQLICGDRCYFVPKWPYKDENVFYPDLMRVCREIYDELLDVLYADNTISLFGTEIAQYFCRNASPEGLRRVRSIHVALTIPSSGWNSRLQRKNIQETVKMLQDSLPVLQYLDIEVVLLWGQPKEPQRFWAWLRNDVLAQFRGLESFVLKVAVYKPFTPPRSWCGFVDWIPDYESLNDWNDREYRDLKSMVTSSDERAS